MRTALTLLSLLLAAPAYAETQIDLAGGLTPTSRTDRVLSPLRHTGTIPTVSLGWGLRQKTALQRFSLDLGIGELRSVPEWDYLRDGETRSSFATPSTMVDFRYAYGRRVGNSKWDLRVGAVQASHLEQHDWAYGHTAVGTYLGTFELAPWVDLRVPFGRRQHLELEGWVPLLSWLVRPPFSMHDGEYNWHNRDSNAVAILFRYIGDGVVATPMDYQAVHLRATWTLDFSKHLALLVAGRFDLIHTPDPRPLSEFQLGLNMGVRGSF